MTPRTASKERLSEALVCRGYCDGCPYNYGHPATETAYNLGCLPSIGEIAELCERNGTAWACHSEPDKVCCGSAARRSLPLQHVEGIHVITPAGRRAIAEGDGK